jgi:hypothetical protein
MEKYHHTLATNRPEIDLNKEKQVEHSFELRRDPLL